MSLYSLHAFGKKTIINIPFFFILVLILLQIQYTNSATFLSICKDNDNFNEPKCFNDIIKFKNKKYRAGHILTNKENTTIIMFSDDSPGDSRLFYSLKENGRGFYYDNETVIKEISIPSINKYERNIVGRYESLNEFVYLQEDTNREKQYLFSISSYYSLSELHDIENGKYQKWVTTDFFNIDSWRYIFSYRFSLFEWKETKVYFCAYVQYKGTDKDGQDYSVSYTISKFKFNKDTTNNEISVRTLEKKIEDESNFDNRIVSAFMIDSYDIIVVFYVKNTGLKNTLKFYDQNLNVINDYEIDTLSEPQPGYGAFIKGLHCQYEYVGLMYYTKGNDGKSLLLRFVKIIKGSDNKYSIEKRIKVELTDQPFQTYILLNDFVKITPDRFIFASTTGYEKLFIYLIQQTNWYKYVKIKKYDHWLPSNTNQIKFQKEFAFGLYKGFLILTTTVSPNSDASNFFSYLIFFGYPNGTDFTDDLTDYFYDIRQNEAKDIATYLIDHASVDNNIFHYDFIRKVKLISIPPEIIIYEKSDLGNPTVKISNGAIIEEGKYLLYQNKQMNKTSELYKLDYQFMVKEPTHNTFFSGASEHGNIGDKDFYNTYENSRQTLYGRVNRLSMKLCHNYCGKCVEK